MADRTEDLTVVKGGISRLRTKGAALKDSLYDLWDGYVTAAKTVKGRPGTFRDYELPSETKGLCAFDGALHTFSAEQVTVPDGIVLHILPHPQGFNEDGSVIPLLKVHFSSPFMGFLYVVAEFEEADPVSEIGNIFHYWLRTGEEWQPDMVYKLGDVVSPSTPNGFAYQATRLLPAKPSWAPNVQRTPGDIIEPTVYNDFQYTVVDVLGTNPRSGTVEPTWPESDGAQVFEDAEGGFVEEPTPTAQPDISTKVDTPTAVRYRNIYLTR